MMKYLTLLFMMPLFAVTLHAQDIEVKGFELVVKDNAAIENPRKDINGMACGLVKVQLKEEGAIFEGNVMGDVDFKGGEYWVYLTNGTKRLNIKHPNYLPITIVFDDYGTKKISSNSTYKLDVKANKAKAKLDMKKMGDITFNIIPSNALLSIDGKLEGGLGSTHTISLPYGIHYYSISYKSFTLSNIQLKIDSKSKIVDVDLTDYFANLNIETENEEDDVIINGEYMSTGTWQGTLPPGKYEVEIKKEGYHSHFQTIELTDNDTQSFTFPPLIPIGGKLNVDYYPKGSDVYIDGKKIGTSPMMAGQIPIGKHLLEIKKDMYNTKSSYITIEDDKTTTAKGELEITTFGKIYECATHPELYDEEDVKNAAGALGNFYLMGEGSCLIEGDYYKIKVGDDNNTEKMDPQKGIEWYKIDEREHWLEICLCYIILKDYSQSFKYAQMMASNEFRETVYYLYHKYRNPGLYLCGWHYYYGRGVQKNDQVAWEYFEKMKPLLSDSDKEKDFKDYIKSYGFMKTDIERIK